MSRATDLEQILATAFTPTFFIIENESNQHAVPAGSESHFNITIVSKRFEKTTRVKRHQLVYACLQDAFSSGLHACALHLHTPEEWDGINGRTPQSPPCARQQKE